MNERVSLWVRWVARVLAVLYALFIGLFALDVWGMEGTFGEKLGGFLIHLTPVYILIVLTIIAWRWPLIGGALFLLCAVVFTLFFNWFGEWQLLLLMAGPLVVIGVLFLTDGWWRREQLQLRY